MKIGLVGYQGCGKTTLFEWLTGVAPDPAAVHASGQSAMAAIPEERVTPLCEIYQPKKITLASLEIVDTPGLSRSHEGNAGRLALIKEAECLVTIVPTFAGAQPQSELASFAEDLLLADMEIVSKRIERLRESVKKPRPSRDQELAELATLEPVLEVLGSGTALVDSDMTDEQRKATKSFRLLTEKPRLVVFNLADNDSEPQRFAKIVAPDQPILAAPLGLELELAKMDEADRAEFEDELEVSTPRKDEFLRKILEVSQQILFFTAGDKEVRTWLLPQGGTAVDAAGNIHTDLARGFIRAEVMRSDDLIRLGSEREIKAHSLLRQEHKDYAVQAGDVLLIRHN